MALPVNGRLFGETAWLHRYPLRAGRCPALGPRETPTAAGVRDSRSHMSTYDPEEIKGSLEARQKVPGWRKRSSESAFKNE